MSPRTITFIVLLFAAALGSWYLSRPDGPASDDTPPLTPEHRGYYLKQARILGTDQDGSLLYEIEAEHAEQQDDNRIEFLDVRIRYAPDSGVPWTVNADRATLREDMPRIALRGDVQFVNNSTDASDETEILSQYMELDPDRFIAETDARVRIRFGSRSVTATGMLASLNDDKIELRANVRGRIIP
ncbi:MAG: LPS export ABC transporter periplasmic protein LptC [Gammaproteobacteria bacterium]|nr:LPS export ABC transporter periplasmic protein LptC [Gammaproteobacteria bacterium]